MSALENNSQMQYSSLLKSKQGYTQQQLQKKIALLKSMKQSDNESQKDKYIDTEIEQTSQQLEQQQQVLEKLKGQNQKLEQEVEELENQMKQVFGDDVLKARNDKKINYQNIVNTNVNEKVQKQREEKKKNDEYLSLKNELLQVDQEIRQYSQKIKMIKQNNSKQKNEQTLNELQNTMKVTNTENKQLLNQRDTLNQINDGLTKGIDKTMQSMGFSQKLNELEEERKEIREQIRLHQQEKLTFDKKMQEFQDELGFVSKKYREACKQAGIAQCTDLEKLQKLEQQQHEDQEIQNQIKEKQKSMFKNKQFLMADKANSNSVKQIRKNQYKNEQAANIDKKIEEMKEMNQQNYETLKKEILERKQNYSSNQKDNESKIESQKQKLGNLDFEKKDLLNRLREKEKEVNILISKFNELKRTAKSSVLLDKNLNLLEAQQNDKNNQNSNQNYLKNILDTKKRGSKREYVGNVQISNSSFKMSTDIYKDMLVFDDHLVIGNDIHNLRLKEVRVFTDQLNTKVYGIQAIYQTNEEEELMGQCNVNYSLMQSQELATQSLVIQEGDFLRFVSGVSSEVIEYLKLETNNKEKICCGVYNDKSSAKEFHLEVKKDNQIVMIFGGLDYKRTSVHCDEQMLAFLGVEHVVSTQNYKKGGQLQKFR